MKNKVVTITLAAHMTSNYGEGLGNIASVQKIYSKGKIYSMRSRESLKNAVMVQSGMYDDLNTYVNGATQKFVDETSNATNTRALEGGYMCTKEMTYVRKSSVYFTDAISCDEFVSEPRFHNNLHLASNYAKANGLNLQEKAGACGLMPYQYEYEKSLKVYSMTIDLEMIGKDQNFNCEEASAEEKTERVNALLTAVENLSLVVKGNLDNAEPIFVVGGLSDRKTHVFENVVRIKKNKLEISEDLKERIQKGYAVGLLKGKNLDNEEEIIEELQPITVAAFFEQLRQQVKDYYLA